MEVINSLEEFTQAPVYWQLLDPAGVAVRLAEALAAIEAKK